MTGPRRAGGERPDRRTGSRPPADAGRYFAATDPVGASGIEYAGEFDRGTRGVRLRHLDTEAVKSPTPNTGGRHAHARHRLTGAYPGVV